MQQNDRWPEDYDPIASRSRPGSRRNSATISRRNSLKRENEKKVPPTSSSSTPRKSLKNNLDFVVTGRQITKRSDRANSLPGSHLRRPSIESGPAKAKKTFESPKRITNPSNYSKSQETSLEDDNSLDLSQVSDFEDTNSKYGIKKKFNALAASTPKPQKTQKTRSCSLQSQIQVQKLEHSRREKSLESTRQSFSSMSRDSMRTCSSGYRYGTDLDYSSVSPEYSGQSSTDISPRVSKPVDTPNTPRSQDMQVSSISTYQDCSDTETKIEDFKRPDTGEWNNFWANYNNSISEVPLKSYYDQCPTPYRTDTLDLADLVLPSDLSHDETRKPSPENLRTTNHVIRQEGLRLNPRETQNVIKCAHILGYVLTRAIERQSNETKTQEVNDNPEVEEKKKSLTLDLKETNVPVPDDFKKETTTQTDISLPNTKSAPKIFENILRQLSRSSLEDKIKESKEIIAKNAEKTKNGNEKKKNETENISAEGNKGKSSDKDGGNYAAVNTEKSIEKGEEIFTEVNKGKTVEKHEEKFTDINKEALIEKDKLHNENLKENDAEKKETEFAKEDKENCGEAFKEETAEMN